MLYGSLYKIFLKLSKQNNNNNNNKKEYNALTIPKIFVKILLNNERKRIKNYFKLKKIIQINISKNYKNLTQTKQRIIKKKKIIIL
jgi:hypothetical protein